MTSSWSEALDDHRAHQREQVLVAALELLDERGMAGLTMSALAQRAGMSRATLYHYFSDVDAVLAAWVGEEIKRSLAALVSEATAIADPLARLEHVIDAQAQIFGSQHHRLNAEHFESEAGAPAVRREVSNQMAPLRHLLAATVSEAQRSGTFRPDLDPELAADLLLGLIAAIRRRLVAGNMQVADAAPAVMALVRDGWAHP
jgi:AcrR family transcriptional regulator